MDSRVSKVCRASRGGKNLVGSLICFDKVINFN
jgi:hypothetical protein